MKTTDKMEHDNMMMEWKSGTVVAAAGGIESALTTTLQPIRDLAKNWDIDIAAWYVTRRPTTTTTWHVSICDFGISCCRN